ncbi:hypothetical protein ES705_45395 [subsurface metagenome]
MDLGYIKWKNYAHRVSLNDSYSIEGVEFSVRDTSFLDNMIDTILSNLELTGTNESFRTTLEPKIFVAGRYFIVPGFDVGQVSRFNFSKEGFQYNLTLLANWRPSPLVSLSGSYSPIGGSAKSFGLGLSVRLGPFHMYFVSDYLTTTYNLVEAVPLPNDIRRYTFRYGLNLVFGCNENKKLRRDKPMYYSDEY